MRLGDAINSVRVEAFNPFLEAAILAAAVCTREFKSAITKQKVNSLQPLLGFLVRAAINSDAQLLHGAVFRIRKLTCAADASFK